MFKRILCALLSGLMLIPLASCSNSDVNSDNKTTPVSTDAPNADATVDAEETKKYLDDMPEKLDFGGIEMRFTIEEGSNGNLTEKSVYVEEDTGDIIDSAVYQRNGIIQDRLNINIVLQNVYTMNNITPLLRTSVTAGTPDYDIVGVYQYYGIGAATEGLVYNLNNLKYNDFSREYWGTDYITAMSYGDASFWATGPISLRYTGGMYVTFVNDRLWNDYYPTLNVYDLVDEGTWTLDKMYELSSNVYVDENGNDTVDALDTVGLALIHTNDIMDGMAAGAMVEFGNYDTNGEPIVTLNNERTYTFYDKIYRLVFNNPGYITPSEDDSVTTMTRYSEGRYMLTCNKLYQSEIYLRDMEDDFKIIPLPKLDETQEHYNTRAHDSVTLFGTPITAYDKFDAISATLEAMASESYRLVSPAYYEVALKTKFTRDSDSGRMIELIAQNVSCDFVTLYSEKLNNINHFFRTQLSGQVQNIASKFKGSEKAWNKTVQIICQQLADVAESQQ